MNIRDNFKKGYVEMLILNFLSEKDLYGYEMTQLVIERGGGYIKIPEGSLYPTLYKLEDKHMISSYQKQVGKRTKYTFVILYQLHFIFHFYESISLIQWSSHIRCL